MEKKNGLISFGYTNLITDRFKVEKFLSIYLCSAGFRSDRHTEAAG